MTDNLTQQLAERAEDFARRGGAELHIDQVLARAGEIKRGRRMRATILMAACVLAVAVPIGVVAANQNGTHDPSPAPPTKVDTGPLTLQGLKTGHEPRGGWFQGRVWHGADGHQFEFTGGTSVGVATVGDATLVATSGPQGETAHLVPPVSGKAQTVTSWPMEGGFARSADGTLAAFVKPDGTPVVVQDSGKRTLELPRIPQGTAFDAVAVFGDDCSGRSGESTCTVWVDSNGKDRAVWTVRPHGTAAEVSDPGHLSAMSVSSTGLVGWLTKVTDSGTCSEVNDMASPPLWKTCDHQLGTFSPDGDHVVAFPAYFDGAGAPEVSVLDAKTGAAVLELPTVRDAYISQVVWEDNDHLLAVVGEGQRSAVIRIGLDGRREYAATPVTGEPYHSPFVLPVR